MRHDGWWRLVLLIVLVGWLAGGTPAWAGPIGITDDAGRKLRFERAPQRVVCLVPSATEIVFAIGGGERLAGITHHGSGLEGADRTPVVGGFFSPSFQRIMALEPDLVILSDLHRRIIDRLPASTPYLVMKTRHMTDAFRHMRLLGTLFGRTAAAEALILKNQRQLEHIARKVAAIPAEQRKRVMRLMGRDVIMTPGRDSFQNEMIRAAGGIPPDFTAAGDVVPVSAAEWTRFNPQVLYGCGVERLAMEPVFSQAGWKAVDAIRQQRIYTLPCDLTCRAGAHLGDFVAWLAALINTEAFADPAREMLPRTVTDRRPVPVDLDMVAAVQVVTSTIHDFDNRSLVIDFKTPRRIVSTLEGQRDGILTVGNHYSPPPCWALTPMKGLDSLQADLYPVLGKTAATTAFLFTGADMNHLSVQKETFRAMTVYGLVTAGVQGNAVRMSRDVGNYYEPGTINMIFLTNMRLTPRAMTRAIISATEGKSAALQDLDIRSSYQPLTAAATGTGTDNIIVVQGDGEVVDNAGGHCKMGELIARAAYTGVIEAIGRQNGIVAGRNVFQRLADRHLSISQLVNTADCDCLGEKSAFTGAVEAVLLDPAYAGFLEAAMAIGDGAERQTVADRDLYAVWCLDVATRIAGRPLAALEHHVADTAMPEVLAMALDAVFTGVAKREGRHE